MSALVSEVDSSPPPELRRRTAVRTHRARVPLRGGQDRTSSMPARTRSLSFRGPGRGRRALGGHASKRRGVGEGRPSASSSAIRSISRLPSWRTMATGRWAAPLDPSTPAHGTGWHAAALARVGGGHRVRRSMAPPTASTSTGSTSALASLDGAPRRPRAAGVTGHRGDSGGAVLASSGTTGVPKVIPLPQEQLLHTARSVSAHHRAHRRTTGGSTRCRSSTSTPKSSVFCPRSSPDRRSCSMTGFTAPTSGS